MKAEELKVWLKEHNNKISIKQIKEIGLTPDEKIDKVWRTDDNKIAIVACNVEDENTIIEITEGNPLVEPVQPPKTEEVLKHMEKFLDTQHYETPINARDILSGKQWYDKFYEHKGRKRWQR